LSFYFLYFLFSKNSQFFNKKSSRLYMFIPM
jgi:hypothetical protein